MAVDFKIKRNDTRPAIEATLGSLTASDTISSVVFSMATNTGTVKVDAASATIVQQASATQSAKVKYQWQTGDTDTSAIYNAEFECTFSDGRIETFPNEGFLKVQVGPDLA
jgi:hypothetical protein